MSKRCVVASVLAIVIVLAVVSLPGATNAQGSTWPPLEIQTALQPQGVLLRYDLVLKNVSDVDLVDVVVKSSLPSGTAFNRFESIDYATTGFDGSDISFTVLKVPAKKMVGPLSAYIDAKGADPNMLQSKLFAEWRGQTPGSLVIPATRLVGGPAEPAKVATVVTSVLEKSTPQATPLPEATPSAAPGSFPLWDMVKTLKGHKFVDLTNTFSSGIPRWPGFPNAQFKTIYEYDKDGLFAQEFVHVGQYGTHLDPPAHFHKGLRTVDQIDLNEMIAPLVVINVADKVAANPDYGLTVDDIRAWEAKYGPVPEGAFVAMRSDWSKRWPDATAYENKDAKGQAHYPGWTVDALKYLYEQRKVLGSGHETADTDAAVAQLKTGFAAESYVLGTNHYQIELLTNLDQVPEAGAMVFVTVPKPRGGSGFPARVFAIVP